MNTQEGGESGQVMPDYIAKELENNSEGKIKVEQFFRKRLDAAVAESPEGDVGEEVIDNIWQMALGDYKNDKPDTKADAGWTGNH